MQENTMYPCVRSAAPYLSAAHKLDNLPPICNLLSKRLLFHQNRHLGRRRLSRCRQGALSLNITKTMTFS